MSTSVADVPPDTDVVVLAVPDDSLAAIVSEIARGERRLRGLVVHVSGVHSVDLLRPAQRKGAMIASLHPVQSFPAAMTVNDRVRTLRGTWFGVEAKGAALDRVKKIVRDLGGKEVLIPSGKKPLYHAACVFASNYVASMLNAASEAFRAAGIGNRWKEMVLPLLMTTVRQALLRSARQALTGPVTRGDALTIGMHIRALQSSAPQLVPLYAAAGIDAARVARQAGRLTLDQFRTLVEGISRSVRTDRVSQESEEEL